MKVPSKLFAEAELRAIAEALGHTDDGLTNPEIDDLLKLCRVPDGVGPATKWKRIFYNLWNQQTRKGTRTNALEFVRQAMQPPRHIKNPDRFHRMRERLNTAMLFVALHVDEAGQLLPAERATTLNEAERRAKELQGDLTARGVHPDVLRFCRAELVQDNYFHAAQEATKSIFDKLRTLTGRSDDGSTLVDGALSGETPLLGVNSLVTDSERSEQRGFANLIKGVYGMFRNPTAHEARIKWNMRKEDAEDLLSLASLIHRRLDAATRLR